MATSTTRKTAAKKAATPAKAAEVEAPKPDVVETVEEQDAPAPVDEPEVDVVDESGDDESGDEQDSDESADEPEAPEAPRQTPGTAALEAPENRIPPGNGVEPTSIVRDGSGQLSVDMLTQGPTEVRSELYDNATGTPPNPDDVFDLEFPNGQAVICQVRLCENLWITGQKEPMSRLVMARGQRTDRAYAEQIIAILKRQLDADAEPAGPLEV